MEQYLQAPMRFRGVHKKNFTFPQLAASIRGLVYFLRQQQQK